MSAIRLAPHSSGHSNPRHKRANSRRPHQLPGHNHPPHWTLLPTRTLLLNFLSNKNTPYPTSAADLFYPIYPLGQKASKMLKLTCYHSPRHRRADLHRPQTTTNSRSKRPLPATASHLPATTLQLQTPNNHLWTPNYQLSPPPTTHEQRTKNGQL